MKNLRITLSLLALAGMPAAGIAAGAAETVELNKTHVMRLSAPAGAIVVGNPKVADISVHSDNTLFVFGRGFGQTDILILDAAGNTLVHTDIKVVEASQKGTVRLIAPGRDRETYACSPYCRPAPAITDNPEFKAKFTPEAAQATGTGTAALSGQGTPQNQGFTGGPATESARSGLSDEDFENAFSQRNRRANEF